MIKNIHIVLVLFILTSCSVAGVRDKSHTIANNGLQTNMIQSLTILPIKDDSAVLGLSDRLETELLKVIQAKLPAARIVSADDFRSRMSENDLINEYAQWKSALDETKIISLRPLWKWAQLFKSRYFLSVKVNLSREKITGADTGYSGFVNDASNVWRTDLKLFTQVIDAKSGTAIWKGVGHAEDVYSPKRIGGSDTWIRWNAKTPNMDEYIGPLIKTAVDGLVENITSEGHSTTGGR
jgi:hypothetical protein